jgi:hypothetical protein
MPAEMKLRALESDRMKLKRMNTRRVFPDYRVLLQDCAVTPNWGFGGELQ